jgi:predicted RNA-binding Zn ribbon-like protein
LIGGRPCLKFVATLGKRHTVPIERLPAPGALADWISQAGLGAGRDGMRVTIEDLAAAHALREALWRLLVAAMGRGVPDQADVAHINQIAAGPDLAPQLAWADAEEEGEPRPLLRWHAARPVRSALATVARDAVLLVGGPVLTRVKECENPECSLLFLDDSQARRRRWCSMERCGNLVKIAGYRSRTRGGSPRASRP